MYSSIVMDSYLFMFKSQFVYDLLLYLILEQFFCLSFFLLCFSLSCAGPSFVGEICNEHRETTCFFSPS